MFIPIIGQEKNKLDPIANKIGQYLHSEHLTYPEVITMLAVLLVRAAQQAGVAREAVLNYVAECFDRARPS